MIDKKKIEKELLRQVESQSWNTMEEQYSYKDGFEDGVEWAQKEFVKSLWYDGKYVPSFSVPCLVYGTFAYEGVTTTGYAVSTYSKTYGWSTSHSKCGDEQLIYRWCYLDDILPKKGCEE